jgi:hypothetical protein
MNFEETKWQTVENARGRTGRYKRRGACSGLVKLSLDHLCFGGYPAAYLKRRWRYQEDRCCCFCTSPGLR